EGLGFRFFYWLFRTTHQLLTGHPAKVGNFSLVPREQLRRLTVVSEIWNNYAAAVYKARLPMDTVPTGRAERIAGKTRMNFASLVSHGLSAMSIYNDVIGVRTLSTAVVITLFSTAAVIGFIKEGGVALLISVIALASCITVCGVLAVFLLIT